MGWTSASLVPDLPPNSLLAGLHTLPLTPTKRNACAFALSPRCQDPTGLVMQKDLGWNLTSKPANLSVPQAPHL